MVLEEDFHHKYFHQIRTKFIREDEHESRLIPNVYTHVDTALKCVTRLLVGPHGLGSPSTTSFRSEKAEVLEA